MPAMIDDSVTHTTTRGCIFFNRHIGCICHMNTFWEGRFYRNSRYMVFGSMFTLQLLLRGKNTDIWCYMPKLRVGKRCKSQEFVMVDYCPCHG